MTRLLQRLFMNVMHRQGMRSLLPTSGRSLATVGAK